MNVADAIKLTDDVRGIAEQLKKGLALERPRRELYEELFSLRRSVEELERRVRQPSPDTLSEAC